MKLRGWVPLLLLAALTVPANAKTLDTCFSPLGHCDQVLISWIKASVKTLDAAIYGLTNDDIADALIDAHRRGVRVRLVHDYSQAQEARDVTRKLQDAGIEVHVQKGSRGGILHNKFLVIDSTYVLTGSFNWTNSATRRNDENFVVLDDQGPKFEREFDRLWALPARTRSSKPRRPYQRHRSCAAEFSLAPPVAF
jgi:phosphatidylserine/phosphatidylglycerophosphate/cardiolipin synthase-like enzyme